MAELRQSRWTKVHEQGQANYVEKENVMDITVGEGRCQAEITYQTTLVRNFRKAAYWLLHSLETAQATQVVHMAEETLQAKAAEADSDTEEIVASGEGWSCTIEKMGDGIFKAQLNWTFEKEAKENEQIALYASDENTAPKKRGRKKKAVA